MQEMDILDMNVLDETENDNGIPAEDYDDDENENFLGEEDAELNEDHDNRDFESEDEARRLEVRQERKLAYQHFHLIIWHNLNVAVLLCILTGG